jgi:hypothetical protein
MKPTMCRMPSNLLEAGCVVGGARTILSAGDKSLACIFFRCIFLRDRE